LLLCLWIEVSDCRQLCRLNHSLRQFLLSRLMTVIRPPLVVAAVYLTRDTFGCKIDDRFKVLIGSSLTSSSAQADLLSHRLVAALRVCLKHVHQSVADTVQAMHA
jgi:hypothetical protein